MQLVDKKDPIAGGPPFRRLFLDASVTEDSDGLKRVFHSVQKYKGNPVIKKDYKWEGWGPYLYGTVLQDDGKLKMWYSCIGEGNKNLCYAESEDGIHWMKPDLGLIEYEGSRANNIVKIGNMASVIKLSDNKWVLYYWRGDKGACAAFSEDGLDWTADTEREKLFETSDVINFFYDPYRSRYTATYKTMNRRHRSAGLAVSKDGLEWSKPVEGAVFGADDLDPDATQIYGMPVFPYQGMYIGLPWIYHSRFIKYGPYSPERMYEAQKDSSNLIDVQMAWTWNLISWNRTPERKPFLALGTKPEWDWGMVFTATAPVVLNDRLHFYYGGFDRAHDDYEGITGAIGFATLRLDGFCSMRAGENEGWLISRREVFTTPKVTINAVTEADGYVTAELLDRNNNVIKGFSRQECKVYTGDSVRAELSWKTKEFPKGYEKVDKKIRFYLKKANLYSYLPVDIDEEQDDGLIFKER